MCQKASSFAGVKMLKNPRVLFMDEPTTGLDSFTAEKLMAMAKKFTQQGMTIACTIHQPSSHVFKLFDRVILMAERTIIYQGPMGTITGENQTCDAVIPYFEEQGYPCEAFCNPAEYLIDLVSISNLEGFHEKAMKYGKIEAMARLSKISLAHHRP